MGSGLPDFVCATERRIRASSTLLEASFPRKRGSRAAAPSLPLDSAISRLYGEDPIDVLFKAVEKIGTPLQEDEPIGVAVE
jgi:hypothetical protein